MESGVGKVKLAAGRNVRGQESSAWLYCLLLRLLLLLLLMACIVGARLCPRFGVCTGRGPLAEEMGLYRTRLRFEYSVE